MSIYRKVKAVERVFKDLETETTKFKTQSGINCLAGCAKCCFKSDIEATPLEFLPFAYHAFLTGTHEGLYTKLSEDGFGSVCALLNPFHAESGSVSGCSAYAYRGLICRLFGFSATWNKYGEPVLATCRPIKGQYAGTLAGTDIAIKERKVNVPFLRDYYFRMKAIDQENGSAFYPINEAMKRAFEMVLTYYSYRPKPRPRKAS